MATSMDSVGNERRDAIDFTHASLRSGACYAASASGSDMMEPAIVSALAAVMGSLVGGSATIATAWITQKTLSRRELMGAEIRKRELLYTEFIAECSRLAIDAYAHTLERPETVLPAYALLNRIRLTSSEDVLAAADQT